MFCRTGAYTKYPLVQLGEGYGPEDLESDNDPGGILRYMILKENAIALQNRNTAEHNKLVMYALMWDTISHESQEAVMQRACVGAARGRRERGRPRGPSDAH
jgi:hypothetical protein